MAQKFYNENDIQAIASAIRGKNGLSSTYTVSQMASAIQNIPSGGGGGNTNIEDSLITKTVSTYENSRVTSVGSYVFSGCNSLTSVSFPQAGYIGSWAFAECSSLTSVSFPQANYIGNYAFAECSSLVSVSFPQAITISANAFCKCRSLTSVSFPQAITIGSYAFSGCNSLTSVSFPQADYIGSYAFWYCGSLTSAILGGQQSKSGMIQAMAFSACYKLINLTLSGSYLYSLSNSDAFSSTPIRGYSAFAGQYGSIYVPASLYNQYISATNWTYFSSRIVSFRDVAGGGTNN